MEAMISFVDAYRDKHGVEPICRVIEIAPSTYHAHVVRRDKPETAPPRVKRDIMLSVEIKRVFDENFQVYGVRKIVRIRWTARGEAGARDQAAIATGLCVQFQGKSSAMRLAG